MSTARSGSRHGAVSRGAASCARSGVSDDLRQTRAWDEKEQLGSAFRDSRLSSKPAARVMATGATAFDANRAVSLERPVGSSLCAPRRHCARRPAWLLLMPQYGSRRMTATQSRCRLASQSGRRPRYAAPSSGQDHRSVGMTVRRSVVTSGGWRCAAGCRPGP